MVWVCGAHVLLGLLLFDPRPFLGGDNFWYMILGESLRSGHGYRDLWLPNAPLHVHYPPVYPLLLAVIGWLSSSVIAFKALSLACTTAAVGFTYAITRRRTGDAALSLAAALLVAVTPAIVEYSHWELSEAPFLLLVTISLYAFVRDPGGDDPSLFAVGSAAALAAYLTRSAGSALLFAIVAGLALRRNWTRLAWFAGVAALVVVGWSLYVRSAATAEGVTYTTYGQEFFYRDPYRPELGRVTVSELVGRVAENLKVYVLSAWPQTIGGRDVGRGLGAGVGLLLGGVVVAGALRSARKPGFPELFALAYVGLILLWPQAWSDQRFLVPLVPLAAVYLVEAITWALPPPPRPPETEEGLGRLRPAHGVVGLCVAFALFANVRIAGASLRCTQAVLGGEPYACYPSAFADFVEASKWIRDHTDSGTVVISRKPQILYWYGRRPGDVYPFTTDADSLVRFLDARKTRYVVVDNLYGTTGRYLVPAIQRHVDRFRLAHLVGNPPTYVLEYVGAAPPPSVRHRRDPRPMPSADEVKAWYNRRYAAQGLASMRPAQAYAVFLDLLAVRPGARLLDVSCGSGFLVAAAQARGVEAFGVDLSDEAVRLARRVAPAARLAVGAGEQLAFRDGTFDYVTCLGSLEHFLDMTQGLREMLRVAKATARFCIMVPNEDFLGWSVLGHRGTEQQDINEHLLPLAAWRRLFETSGLEVLRVAPDRWHAVKWRSGRGAGVARFVAGPLLEAAWRLLPLGWQYQFVFILQPRRSP